MAILQPEIDDSYFSTPEEEIIARIAARRAELGDKVLILCHHYQQDAVFRFADLTGDSLKLARLAAQRDNPFIIFCGVHFMAEGADMLSAPDQQVILPDLRAGCPMADMATVEEIEEAWTELAEAVPEAKVIPITYVNSSAAVKNFVGRRGGSVCTSSNARQVLEWAFSQGDKVFFFPDEHLGRNTSEAMGLSEDEIALCRREEFQGGNSAETLKAAKTILWDGYCTVHMQFQAAHVHQWRKKDPEIKIIVHPECRNDVVRISDESGSTEKIINTIAASPPGSHWAVGTEINLVKRLAEELPDREIHSLSPFQCLCSTMYRIKPGYLLWVMDNLAQGRVVNRITVDPEIAEGARMALERMLSIK